MLSGQDQVNQARRQIEHDIERERFGWKPYGAKQTYATPTNRPGNTFWENPQRVARYYNAVRALPPGSPTPSWLDKQSLQNAYTTFSKANPGQHWTSWQALPDSDPAREQLRSMALPPPEAMNPGERNQFMGGYWDRSEPEGVYRVPLESALRVFGAEQVNTFGVDQGNVLIPSAWMDQYTNPANVSTPTQVYTPPEAIGEQVNGIPKETWDQLPTWQKVIIPALPAVNKAVGAIGGGLAGFSVGGLVGGAIGAAGGLGLAAGAEQSPTLANLLMKLDLPAEWLERSMGVLGQIGYSIQDAEKYGPVTEILQNLPAAWKAGHLAEDVASFAVPGVGGYRYDPKTGRETITSWELGNPTPEVWSAPDGQMASGWALTEARRRISKGESAEAVWEDIGGRFGFAGQVRDMIGHMLLDPLNLLGEVTNTVGLKAAKLAGNVPLAKAFASSTETLDAMRMYGQALRHLPTEEAAKYGAVSRWIAGLDQAGGIADFAQPASKVNPLDYLRGLDPKSRALEVLSQTTGGLDVIFSDVDDPLEIGRMINNLGNVKPGEAVKALDASELPRWFSSAEAQVIPTAIRDQVPKVNELLDQWKISRSQAGILTRVAEMMDVTPEKLIADLHGGNRADADALFRAFTDRLKAAADGGDQQAGKILKALTDDQLNGLNGSKLREMAELFAGKDSVPFREQEFKYRTMVTLTEGIDQWAAGWYGVKPQGWAIRMGNVIKKAQGLALLGFNPTYLFNNALNNMVTLAYDGLLTGSTHRTRAKFLKDLGISPVRLRQGIGAADISELSGRLGGEEIGRAIRDAGVAKDGMQAINDFFGKGDKFGIFTRLSGKVEEWSSEMAMVNAMRQYWGRVWREGSGFDRVPNDLKMALDAVQPGLAARVERAIARGKSRAQIEKEVFQNLGKRSVKEVLTPNELEILDHFPGVVDKLDRGASEAKTPEDVRAVFTDVKREIQAQQTRMIGENVQRMVNDAAARIQVEGGQAVLDIADEIAQARTDFWLEHFRKMDEVADEAAKHQGQARRAIWQNAMTQADRDWQNFQNIEGAKWLGMFRGLGASDDVYNQVLGHMTDIHDSWSRFFSERRRLMDEFGDASEGLDKAASSQMWTETNQRLNAEYVDALLEEDRLQGALDELFTQAYEKQSPGLGQSAAAWRDAVRQVRRSMTEAMALYRTATIPPNMMQTFGNLLPAEIFQRIGQINQGRPLFSLDVKSRDAASKTFYKEIYTPFIRQLLDASNGNTPGMKPKGPGPGQPPLPGVMGPAAPTPPRQPTNPGVWQAVSERRPDLAGVDANGDLIPGAKLEVTKYVLRYNADARGRVKRFQDITPEDIHKAADAEAQIKAMEQPLPEQPAAESPVESPVVKPAEELQAKPAGETPETIVQEPAAVEQPAAAKTARQAYEQKIDENADLTAEEKAWLKSPAMDSAHPVVREQVQRAAKSLRADMATTGSVVNKETHVVSREGMPWYWAIYDAVSEAEKGKLHERMVKALEYIMKGEEPKVEGPLMDLTREMRAYLLDYVEGKTPIYDEEPGTFADAGALWHMGRKQEVVDIIQSRSDETLPADYWTQVFGDPQAADDALAAWVEWLATQEPATTGYNLVGEEISQGWRLQQPDLELINQLRERNLARAQQMEAGVRLLEEPHRVGRESTHRALVEILGEEKAEPVAAVFDAIAATWARERGLEPEDWYQTFLVERGGVEGLGATAQAAEAGTIKKGITYWTESGQAVVHAFEAADASTMVHEVAHVWLPQMLEDDLSTVARWLKDEHKIEVGEGWEYEAAGNRQAHELFARAFERYLADGSAPSPKLASVFEKFKNWMLEIYREITGSDIDVKLNDEMRALFDRWLGDRPPREPEIDLEKPGPSLWDAPEGQASLFGDAEAPWQLTQQRARDETFNPQAEQQPALFDRGPAQGIEGKRADFHGREIQPGRQILGGNLTPEQARFMEATHTSPLSRAATAGYKQEDIRELIDAGLIRHISTHMKTDKHKVYELTREGLEVREQYFRVKRRSEQQPGALFQTAPAIETPAFREWFGESKVVDEQGRPLKVYHGTTKDFTAFEAGAEKNTVHPSNSLGFFFTEKASVAGSFIPLEKNDWPLRYKEGANIMPVYLSIKNPLEINYRNLLGLTKEAAIKLRDQAIKDRHDGIIVKADPSLKGSMLDEFEFRQFVVFDPAQIKSVNNRGTFNPNSPNILFQEAPEPVRSPRGTADELRQPPVEEAILTGWMREIAPALDRAENALAGAPRQEATLDGVDPNTNRALRAYLGKVYGQLSEAKMGALRFGEAKRDAALLNYSRRYGFDNVLGVAMPYEFWYTHSMLQWALRALNKPAVFANYARIKTFGEEAMDREGFPYRLRKKAGIRLPFLPEWMGENIYIDPMKQSFPFETFARPFEALAEQTNQTQRRAEGLLQEMIDGEEVTAEEAAQALETKSGVLWEKAMAQAKNDVEQDIQNPLDFATMMSGLSLPLNYLKLYMQGRKDEIGQLPITRMIQANTAALGIGGPRGVNIEAGVRKAAGLPEVDRYEDYRVDRMLAGMAAEGTISAEDAKLAMIDRTGPAFEQAQRRVSAMGAWQYWGAPLGVDFFPEGEQDMRQLKTEYDRALTAWKGGQKDALSQFFAKYPEYKARMASFQEPEERMKKFLISEVWDAYNQLPDLYKRQAREQLGDVFQDAFLSKETRSYDSLTPETLTSWARMMKSQNLPQTAPDTPQLSLSLASEEDAAAVQAYNTEKAELFPGLSEAMDLYYQIPEEERAQYRSMPEIQQVEDYFAWRTQYLADHPAVIPWTTSEESELNGLPVELQSYVYKYRAQKEQLYPRIEEMQNEYFNLPNEQRGAYIEAHPQLVDYWDWRKQMAAANPNAAPYILSDATISQALLGDQELNFYVQGFYDDRDQYFPGIMDTQSQYFDLDQQQRKAFLRQHPELAQYWDWRKQVAAAYPEAAAQILSDSTLRKAIGGEDAVATEQSLTPEIMADMDAALVRQLMGYLYGGQSLSTGALQELSRLWRKHGQPGPGTFQEWLEGIR